MGIGNRNALQLCAFGLAIEFFRSAIANYHFPILNPFFAVSRTTPVDSPLPQAVATRPDY